MTAASRDEDILLTDRDWRGRWAAELTRANALERELDQTRRARDAARTTNDMLTDHCEGQGRRIAFLDMNIEALKEASDAWQALSAGNFARADKLAAWIAFTAKEAGYTHDDLADLIREAGVECEACNGSGVEYPCGPGDGDWADASEQCEACRGIGRVLR